MSEKEYKTKCENMFAQNTVLINENESFKKQIEIMKNCFNCKYGSGLSYGVSRLTCRKYLDCKNYSKWELKCKNHRCN